MYPNGVGLIALTFVVVIAVGRWVVSIIRVHQFKRQMGWIDVTGDIMVMVMEIVSTYHVKHEIPKKH